MIILSNVPEAKSHVSFGNKLKRYSDKYSIVDSSYAKRQRDVETGTILARDSKARNRFRGIASGEDPMKTRQIVRNDYPAARYRSCAQYTTSLVI